MKLLSGAVISQNAKYPCFYAIASLLVIVLSLSGVRAQDTCDLAPVANLMTIAQEQLAEDTAVALDTLAELQILIGLTRAECAELSFSSETDGQRPVIGPLSLEAGTWIATASSESILSAELIVMEGECDGGYIFTILQGGEGEQTVIQSDGCEALLQMSNTIGAWSISFSRL